MSHRLTHDEHFTIISEMNIYNKLGKGGTSALLMYHHRSRSTYINTTDEVATSRSTAQSVLSQSGAGPGKLGNTSRRVHLWCIDYYCPLTNNS